MQWNRNRKNAFREKMGINLFSQNTSSKCIHPKSRKLITNFRKIHHKIVLFLEFRLKRLLDLKLLTSVGSSIITKTFYIYVYRYLLFQGVCKAIDREAFMVQIHSTLFLKTKFNDLKRPLLFFLMKKSILQHKPPLSVFRNLLLATTLSVWCIIRISAQINWIKNENKFRTSQPMYQ